MAQELLLNTIKLVSSVTDCSVPKAPVNIDHCFIVKHKFFWGKNKEQKTLSKSQIKAMLLELTNVAVQCMFSKKTKRHFPGCLGPNDKSRLLTVTAESALFYPRTRG